MSRVGAIIDHRVVRRLFDPRLVGGIRAGVGAAMLAAPTPVAKRWVGDDGTSASVLVRSVGARDLAIGLGLMANPTTAWLAASHGADLADGLEATVGSVPRSRRPTVRRLAFGFGAYGLVSLLVERRR